MPRLQLHGVLSSSDDTQLEGVAEMGLSLAGEVQDQADLIGSLTTSITMAGGLALSLTLLGAMGTGEFYGALSASLSLAGALSTEIRLAGVMPLQLDLGGVVRAIPTGDWEPTGAPDESWPHELMPTANRSIMTPTRNRSEARMVYP